VKHIVAIGTASAVLLCAAPEFGAAKAISFGRPKQPTADEYVLLNLLNFFCQGKHASFCLDSTTVTLFYL
jgi:hypothetical protein